MMMKCLPTAAIAAEQIGSQSDSVVEPLTAVDLVQGGCKQGYWVNFVLKMMNCVLTTMNCVLNMMNCVLTTMNLLH